LARDQPGGSTANTVPSAHHLAFVNCRYGTAISESSTQRLKIDTEIGRMSVDDGIVSQVLTENKMSGEEISVELCKFARLVPSDPFGSSEGATSVRKPRRPI
jgi:hypothetical protein